MVNGVDNSARRCLYPGMSAAPRAMLYGLMQLQRKVKLQRFFDGVNDRPADMKNSLRRNDLTAGRDGPDMNEEKVALTDKAKNRGLPPYGPRPAKGYSPCLRRLFARGRAPEEPRFRFPCAA